MKADFWDFIKMSTKHNGDCISHDCKFSIKANGAKHTVYEVVIGYRSLTLISDRGYLEYDINDVSGYDTALLVDFGENE
jgi:hypothetical protein